MIILIIALDVIPSFWISKLVYWGMQIWRIINQISKVPVYLRKAMDLITA
jgi:hypothetical protein